MCDCRCLPGPLASDPQSWNYRCELTDVGAGTKLTSSANSQQMLLTSEPSFQHLISPPKYAHVHLPEVNADCYPQERVQVFWCRVSY